MSEILEHGGGLSAAKLTRPGRADWLDLSTGINPWPYPVPAVPQDAWMRLPDTDRIDALEAAAARFYGAPGRVLAVPGTQAALQALPLLRRPGAVAVLGFTYQEHARCWRRAGHAVTLADTLDAACATADVVVAVNPNNPDGRRIAPGHLLEARAALAARGGWLIVDEAFGEVTPDLSVAAHTGAPGLVVLRSFGKFFGLAGLRLGFVAAEPTVCAGLADALGPWAVSGPAAEIGRAALSDGPWIAATRRRLGEAAADLDALLRRGGLEPAGGTDLFRLAAGREAAGLHERLLDAGILVRRFAGRPHWLRFGLPPDAAAAARLEAALTVGRRVPAYGAGRDAPS